MPLEVGHSQSLNESHDNYLNLTLSTVAGDKSVSIDKKYAFKFQGKPGTVHSRVSKSSAINGMMPALSYHWCVVLANADRKDKIEPEDRMSMNNAHSLVFFSTRLVLDKVDWPERAKIPIFNAS